MKKSIIYVILLFVGQYSYAQQLNDYYEGAFTRDGAVQLISIDFHVENDRQKATYSIPEAGIFRVPVEKVIFTNDTLVLKLFYGVFHCFIQNGGIEITGLSEKWKPKLRLHLKQTKKNDLTYEEEEITFNNAKIQLAGLLFKPKSLGNQSRHYVVLVHGSGAQDRDTPYYVSIADQLARAGIGVLLYDKRGTGLSQGDYLRASFDDLAQDAIAAMQYLKDRKDLKIAKIGLLGSSQAGWIVPKAANETKVCDFIILNVCPAVSVFEQDIHRVVYEMKGDGWPQKDIDAARRYTEAYFKFARTNRVQDWELLQDQIKQVQDKKWLYFLNIPEDKKDFDWWRLHDFDPQEALKTLQQPVLSIFGEADYLVPPQENKALMESYLAEAKVQYEVITVPDASHDMKTFHGLNGDNWDWPYVYWQWRKQPEMFLDRIIQFVKSQ